MLGEGLEGDLADCGREKILGEMLIGREAKKLASEEGVDSEGYTLDEKDLIPTEVIR
jgi:hypothetical protein